MDEHEPDDRVENVVPGAADDEENAAAPHDPPTELSGDLGGAPVDGARHDVQALAAPPVEESGPSIEERGESQAVASVWDTGNETGPSLRASAELKAILEALIFASPDPLTPKAMYKLLDAEPQEDVDAALRSAQTGLRSARRPATRRGRRRLPDRDPPGPARMGAAAVS